MIPDDMLAKLESEAKTFEMFRDRDGWRCQLTWSNECEEFAEGTGNTIQEALEGALDDLEQQRNGGT